MIDVIYQQPVFGNCQQRLCWPLVFTWWPAAGGGGAAAVVETSSSVHTHSCYYMNLKMLLSIIYD